MLISTLHHYNKVQSFPIFSFIIHHSIAPCNCCYLTGFEITLVGLELNIAFNYKTNNNDK